MAIGFRASGVLVAVAFSGLMLSAQVATAPRALACAEGQLEDSITGMCWSQSGQGQSYGGPGEGPCLPGRLGNCIGTLQKSSDLDSGNWNSAVPCGFGPAGGAPCQNW